MKRLLDNGITEECRRWILTFGLGWSLTVLFERPISPSFFFAVLPEEEEEEEEVDGTGKWKRAGLLLLRRNLWTGRLGAGILFCRERLGLRPSFWGTLADFGVLLFVEAAGSVGWELLFCRSWIVSSFSRSFDLRSATSIVSISMVMSARSLLTVLVLRRSDRFSEEPLIVLSSDDCRLTGDFFPSAVWQKRTVTTHIYLLLTDYSGFYEVYSSFCWLWKHWDSCKNHSYRLVLK